MIDALKNNPNPEFLSATLGTELKTLNAKDLKQIVPSALSSLNPGSFLGEDLPVLTPPANLNISMLDTDALMSLLQSEQRTSAVKSGVASLQANAEMRREENNKIIDSLNQKIEEAEKKSKLSVIQKIFSWFSAIASTIAAAVTVAAGVVTGNPLLIGAGVLMGVVAADLIAQAATGGEKSISGELNKLCQGAGTGTMIALQVLAVGLSLGAALAPTMAQTAASAGAQIASKIGTSASAVISGLSTAGSAATGIVAAGYDKRIALHQADVKIFEAALEKLNLARDFDEEEVKRLIEGFNELNDGVKACVDELNEALSVTVAGGRMGSMA